MASEQKRQLINKFKLRNNADNPPEVESSQLRTEDNEARGYSALSTKTRDEAATLQQVQRATLAQKSEIESSINQQLKSLHNKNNKLDVQLDQKPLTSQLRQEANKTRAYSSLSTRAVDEAGPFQQVQSATLAQKNEMEDSINQQLKLLQEKNKELEIKFNEKTQQEANLQTELFHLKKLQADKLEVLKTQLDVKTQHQVVITSNLETLQNKSTNYEKQISDLEHKLSQECKEKTALEEYLRTVTAQNVKYKEELEYVVETMNAEKKDLWAKFEEFRNFTVSLLETYENEKNNFLKVLEQHGNCDSD